MESMHSMSEILFNQVEQIADVKTCNVDNVEHKYYKVQWKCTWEPATVLERFCGKIIADYNKHPKHQTKTVEQTESRDRAKGNNDSTNVIGKSAVNVNCKTELLKDTPHLFFPSSNLNIAKLQNVNIEIDKEDSQNTSNIFNKEPSDICVTNIKSDPDQEEVFPNILVHLKDTTHFQSNNFRHSQLQNVNAEKHIEDSQIRSNIFEPSEIYATNNDVLSERPLKKYSNTNNLTQHQFESVNNLTLNNFTIKPDPDQEVFPNINILCESYPTTFNHREESNTTSEIQNKELSTPHATADSKTGLGNNLTINKSIIVVSKIRRNPIKPKICFNCHLCSYSSPLKSKLKRHMLTHHGEKSFKCSECSYSASNKSTIERHLLTHTGEKPFKCQLCVYSAAQKGSIKSHMLVHTGERHICKGTQKIIVNVMESMHSMSHLLFNQVEQIADVKTCNIDNVEQKYYKVQWKCTWEPATVLERFCGEIIDDYNKQPKHQTEPVKKTKCRDVKVFTVNTETEKEDSRITPSLVIKEKFTACSTTNDVLYEDLPVNNYSSATQHTFESVNKLALNNFTIKPDPDQEVFPNINILCESNPTTFNHGEESNTTSEDTNKEQNKGFSAYSGDLITESCSKFSKNISKSTTAKNNGKRNQENQLLKECFKCQLCSFFTSQKSNIKIHMRKHTSEKPFKCSICSYSTSCKTDIKRHMPKHTGDYPFKCNLCSYSTTRKHRLKRHNISKHKGQDLI